MLSSSLFHFSTTMNLLAFSGVIARSKLFRHFAMLFRFVEFCVALIFLSWTFSRAPLLVRISGEYLRQLLDFLFTPLFAFILCNGIVVTLLVRPRGFSGRCSATGVSETEPHRELIENSSHQPEFLAEKGSEKDEVIFQDKQIVSEVKSHAAEIDSDTDSESDSGLETPKVYKRSQSEKIIKRDLSEKSPPKLRRTETEKCSSIERYQVFPEESLYYQDDLSCDEFKQKIEAFIAKELRSRREESADIVI